jgi:hypothetical protein
MDIRRITMIAFEVMLNGKRVCTAGAEDLGVLTAIVSAVGKLGKKTVRDRPDETTGEVHYSIAGLTSRADPNKNVHVKWTSIAPLRTGDVIQVRVIETERADRAKSRTTANPRRCPTRPPEPPPNELLSSSR